MEIAVPGICIQFVHLQTCGFRRSGVVLLAREGSTEAIDAPLAGRGLPGKNAILHLVSQVDGLLHWGVCAWRGELQQVSRCGKASFLLGVVYLIYRIQFPLMDGGASRYHHLGTIVDQTVVWLGVDHRQAEVLGGGFRDVHSDLFQIGRRHADHFRPRLAILTAQERIVVSAIGLELSLYLSAHQGKGADGHSLGEVVLDPGVGAFFVERQFRTVIDIAVGELLHGKISTAGGDSSAEFLHTLFCLRHLDGHHGNVLIPLGDLFEYGCIDAGTHVLEAADVLIRLG